MSESYVTSKGQLVIPAELRKKYGIETGTRVVFLEREHEIVMQPVTREFVRSMHGMLKSRRSATQDLLAERAGDKRAEEKKIGKRRSR
jgi:AbrB family looped-hinge helix DNA binding protein